jgi:hypothetical protein
MIVWSSVIPMMEALQHNIWQGAVGLAFGGRFEGLFVLTARETQTRNSGISKRR